MLALDLPWELHLASYSECFCSKTLGLESSSEQRSGLLSLL